LISSVDKEQNSGLKNAFTWSRVLQNALKCRHYLSIDKEVVDVVATCVSIVKHDISRSTYFSFIWL
jgi:hypothetical protein